MKFSGVFTRLPEPRATLPWPGPLGGADLASGCHSSGRGVCLSSHATMNAVSREGSLLFQRTVGVWEGERRALL